MNKLLKNIYHIYLIYLVGIVFFLAPGITTSRAHPDHSDDNSLYEFTGVSFISIDEESSNIYIQISNYNEIQVPIISVTGFDQNKEPLFSEEFVSTEDSLTIPTSNAVYSVSADIIINENEERMVLDTIQFNNLYFNDDVEYISSNNEPTTYSSIDVLYNNSVTIGIIFLLAVVIIGVVVFYKFKSIQ